MSRLLRKGTPEYNHWQCLRRAMAKGDKACVKCGSEGSDLDHIISIHRGGDLFSRDNLQWLCKACHKLKTRIENRIGSRMVNSYKRRKVDVNGIYYSPPSPHMGTQATEISPEREKDSSLALIYTHP